MKKKKKNLYKIICTQVERETKETHHMLVI